MRPAEARLQASIMMSNSIRWSLTGAPVGWMMKTSRWRTFSRMRTKELSLANLNTSAWLNGMSRYSQTDWARAG